MCQFANFCSYYVTFVCHLYRVNWHAKSLLSKGIAKIGTLKVVDHPANYGGLQKYNTKYNKISQGGSGQEHLGHCFTK